MLISAFRATLEEVRSADAIVHVRDIAHVDSDAQARDVATILAEIEVVDAADKTVEVRNKIDRLDPEHRAALAAESGEGSPIAVSALTGEGVDRLLAAIEAKLARGRKLIDLSLESADGQGLHWLYEHTEVMTRCDDEDGAIRLTVRVPADAVDRVRRRFGAAAR